MTLNQEHSPILPAIVGQGAIASLLAGWFDSAHFDYAMIAANRSISPFSITLMGQQRKRLCPTETQIQQTQFIIVPLKAMHVVPFIQQHQASIHPECTVMLLHNGMGCAEQVAAMLPNHSIIVATTSYAAFRDSRAHTIQTGEGDIQLGWFQHPNSALQQRLSNVLGSAIDHIHWRSDIQQVLWNKLVVNAVINPLTALDQVQNGALLTAQYQHKISQIVEEVAPIMRKLGLDADPEQLTARVRQVAEKTAKNYSSMNRDVAAGRDTEIDFINGYIVDQAALQGLSAPINQTLVKQIKAGDKSQRF